MRILWQLFTCFFKVGLFTIGGGMAMLPFIHNTVVEERKWLSEEEMVDCIAVSQSLPGVIAINSATYVGSRKAGLPGALAASAGVVLPSFVIIILVSLFLGKLGDNKYVEGAFTGVKAASCGLILFSAYKLGRHAIRGWFTWTMAVLSFVIIAVFRISAIWAIVAGAVLGVLYLFLYVEKGAQK